MSSDEERALRLAVAARVFDNNLGTWDADAEIFAAAGAAPLRQRGVSVNRLVAERWLVTDYTSDSGYEGHGVYGWDDVKGHYVGSWVDSMGGAMARSQGTWDEATRSMTYVTEVGDSPDVRRYREVTRTLSDGVLLYENLVPTPDGGEFLLIRITYRRRQRTFTGESDYSSTEALATNCLVTILFGVARSMRLRSQTRAGFSSFARRPNCQDSFTNREVRGTRSAS
jgi:hypothetical protein